MADTTWIALKDVCSEYGYTFEYAKHLARRGDFPVATFKVGRVFVVDRQVHSEYLRIQNESRLFHRKTGLNQLYQSTLGLGNHMTSTNEKAVIVNGVTKIANDLYRMFCAAPDEPVDFYESRGTDTLEGKCWLAASRTYYTMLLAECVDEEGSRKCVAAESILFS